jgi:hypothetical protein
MLRAQAADLHKPPVTFDALLERLFRAVPDLAKAVRDHLATVGAEGPRDGLERKQVLREDNEV